MLFGFFQLFRGLAGTDDFLGTGSPRTLAEDFFHIFCKDNFFVDQQLSQFVMPFFMFGKDSFGSFILLVYHLFHFFINQFGCFFAIWAVERIFLIIIIA